MSVMVKMMIGDIHILLDNEMITKGEVTEIIKNQTRIIRMIIEEGSKVER